LCGPHVEHVVSEAAITCEWYNRVGTIKFKASCFEAVIFAFDVYDLTALAFVVTNQDRAGWNFKRIVLVTQWEFVRNHKVVTNNHRVVVALWSNGIANGVRTTDIVVFRKTIIVVGSAKQRPLGEFEIKLIAVAKFIICKVGITVIFWVAVPVDL
jgi:hypothetical protein